MTDKIGKAKGSTFIYSRQYIINNDGEGIWLKTIESLTDEEKDFCKADLSPHEWYPVYMLNKVFRSYDKIVGSGDYRAVIPIAKYIAEKDLLPVFDIFVNLKNPAFVLQNIPSIWNRYFDTGKVNFEIADAEKKHFQYSLEDGVDENRYSGQAICKYGTTVWIETALKITGAKNIEVGHPKCRYDNNPVCLTEVRWG